MHSAHVTSLLLHKQACACMQSNLNEQMVMLDHVEIMLRDAGRVGLDSRAEALAFVGRNFRMHLNIHETKSDVEVDQSPLPFSVIPGCSAPSMPCTLQSSPCMFDQADAHQYTLDPVSCCLPPCWSSSRCGRHCCSLHCSPLTNKAHEAHWHACLQAGETVLRQNVFIHLPEPEDKLAALAAMLTKLWAFVGGHCGEDSSDALTHHEVLLPGQLMMKATTERLSVWLTTFTDLVSLL